MKSIIALIFIFAASVGIAQNPDRTEMEKIFQEIIGPIKNGSIDQVLSRTVFPLDVGNKQYTSKTFRTNFSKIFIEGYAECLLDPQNYQLAMPEDKEWFLAVCMIAPENFEATVFSFLKEDGVWKLKNISFQ